MLNRSRSVRRQSEAYARRGAALCGSATGVMLALAALPVASQAQESRTGDSRPAIVAVRATSPVHVDGIFDEPFWTLARAVTGFVQSEPREGQPATERTEVRVAYDADNLYIAAYMHDTEPNAVVVNEIRKDFKAEDQDTFELLLDTFTDRRNGYVFMTNAEGARGDQQSANEGREVNTSWDAVWTVKTRRMPDGWTAEMAIPFRALRSARTATPAPAVQANVAGTVGGESTTRLQSAGATLRVADAQAPVVWGVNFSRRIRRRNEIDFWAPVPRAYNLTRASLEGDLQGLPANAGGRDLRFKPYIAGRALRETGLRHVGTTQDVGVDLKYGVSSGLTLNGTVNPDFAQVEVDEQQVNLTQFSQFFPEKREFFLENSGVFYVGDAARSNRVFTPPTPDEDLLLFFSRRIGLNADGEEIPIMGGARLTGHAGGFVLGALSTQTKRSASAPATNYSVLRVRRNLLRNSDVGGIFMMRQNTDEGDDFNRVYGADFNLRLPARTDWNSYLIHTQSPTVAGGGWALRSSFNHEGNFYHGKGGLMVIDDGFVNDMGYYRRTGVHKWLLDTGLRPRPELLRRHGIREMHPHLTWDYYTDLHGAMIAKKLHSGYTFFLDNGGFIELSANPRFEQIDAPLLLHPAADSLPAGHYGWNEWTLKVVTDPSRFASVNFTGTTGGLWSGTQKTVQATLALKPSYRFRTTLGAQRTDARLDAPVGNFVRTIWTARTNYSFNTGMFIDAFAQYDPDQKQFNTNIRFNVIHHPLSDLFIVYNEQRITGIGAPLPGRSVIIKVTRMFSF